MKNIAIVLAAGKGSRMKSEIPKPLHLINGKTLVYTLVEKLYNNDRIDRIVVVVGDSANQIIINLGDFNDKIDYIIQKEQLGTGHAIKCCKKFIQTRYPFDRSLILFADSPLLSHETLDNILDKKGECFACICKKKNPTGSGRILLDSDGKILNSIEEKDCTIEQRKVKLVNVGIYLIENSLILQNIDEIKNNNSQKEYYLPDLVLILIRKEYKVFPILLENEDELVNINTKEDLRKANSIKRF
jgi:bifunctional UDP-N-acetylglucosamine pyrophosphorylase / glucosamine-1-phosphate N-acetyltransferase